jgi:hypothetical protein
VHVLADAHAPEDDRALGGRIRARHRAQRRGIDPADLGHRLGRELLQVLLELLEACGVRLDVLAVVQLLLDDHVHERVQERDVGAGLELQHVRGVLLERLPARVHDDQGLALLGRLLEVGRGDRVVLGRIGADHDDHVGVPDRGERGGDRARADVLQERRHRAGVAKARAVVDVVRAEPGADQLLDEVGLLVRPLGRAEAGKRARAVAIADRAQALRGPVQSLLPARLAEMGERIGRIDVVVDHLRDTVLADQRPHQAMGMIDVVEAEAALDAQPVLVGRAVAPGDVADLVVLDLVGDLAADAAVRAHAVHPAVDLGVADAPLVDDRRRHQGAGRTGLHALAARDAGATTHRVVHVEHDLGADVAVRHADDVVDLDFATGAHAEIAMDAGIQVHRHCGMAEVGGWVRALRETRAAHVHALRPLPQLGFGMVRDRPLRLIGEQKFHDHAPHGLGTIRRGDHIHAGGRLADAGRRERALAVDLDHAGAAVAIGPIAGLGQPAQVRDVDPLALGNLPDGLAGARLHLAAVEGKFDRIRHDGSLNRICPCRANTPRTSAITKPAIHFSRRTSALTSPRSSRSFPISPS